MSVKVTLPEMLTNGVASFDFEHLTTIRNIKREVSTRVNLIFFIVDKSLVDIFSFPVCLHAKVKSEINEGT
ncbi:hypothetical protein WSM22_20170 [Cytophagales bacterium WSM2-2]|nr:hypothetical protein WSM22_20170 [Cytophagales bacterium WSM2-2]